MSRSIHRLLNRTLSARLRDGLRRMAVATIPSMRHLDMRARLHNMYECGFSPRLIVDVGAGRGDWARMAASVWKDAKIIGFEPNVSDRGALELTRRHLPQFEYHSAFLGPTRQTVAYEQAGHQTSLCVPPTESFQGATAEMFAFDEWIASRNVSAPNLIKIDVQGYELEVLKGAEQTLTTCSAVLLETNFIRFAARVSTIDETIQFMHEHGFAWYDSMGILRRRRDDVLSQMDVMFVRRGHDLRTDPSCW